MIVFKGAPPAAAPPPLAAPAPDRVYSPGYVEYLLRDYARLRAELESGAKPTPPRDPDEAPGRRRTPYPPVENTLALLTDIDRALRLLPPFARRVAWRCYVMGEPVYHVARILRCRKELVTETKRAVPTAMAQMLGWSPADARLEKGTC